MKYTKTSLLILTIGLIMINLISTVQSNNNNNNIVNLEMGLFRSECKGTIGECLETQTNELDFEFELDSEIHRRILAQTRYISYGALNRNRVPCSRRGASYYNCRPGAHANPYRRGCSAIARCRRS